MIYNFNMKFFNCKITFLFFLLSSFFFISCSSLPANYATKIVIEYPTSSLIFENNKAIPNMFFSYSAFDKKDLPAVAFGVNFEIIPNIIDDSITGLPPGLIIDRNGILYGTPNVVFKNDELSQSYTFGLKAVSSVPQLSSEQVNISIQINRQSISSIQTIADVPTTISANTIFPPISITFFSLPINCYFDRSLIVWNWNASDEVKSCLNANFESPSFNPVDNIPIISQNTSTSFLEPMLYEFIVWGVYNNDSSVYFGAVDFNFTVI